MPTAKGWITLKTGNRGVVDVSDVVGAIEGIAVSSRSDGWHTHDRSIPGRNGLEDALAAGEVGQP